MYLNSISYLYCILLPFYTSNYLTAADSIYRTSPSPPKVKHRTVPALQHHHRAPQVFCEGANRIIIGHQRTSLTKRNSPVGLYKTAHHLKKRVVPPELIPTTVGVFFPHLL